MGQNGQSCLGQNGQMLLTYGTWLAYDVVFIHTIMLTGTASKNVKNVLILMKHFSKKKKLKAFHYPSAAVVVAHNAPEFLPFHVLFTYFHFAPGLCPFCILQLQTYDSR